MALETFNFPYHLFSTQNPESGLRISLGNNYTFTSPSESPDQRSFTLRFAAMQFFLDSEGNIDENEEPEINMMTLIRFYQAHKLHKSFIYPHPIHGELEVKFNSPLNEVEGIPNGNGVTQPVEIQLIEIP